MKKTKLIALTMVVALMVVGAGYAAWTDSLTFTNTVNTGYLNVHFVDLPDVEEITGLTETVNGNIRYYYDADGNDGQEDAASFDKAVITINNAYPEASYTAKLKIKNNGTMPVKLDLADLLTQANIVQNDESNAINTFLLSGMSAKIGTDNYTGGQIDPTEEVVIQFTCTVPDDIRIIENSSYSVTLIPNFIQFNQ